MTSAEMRGYIPGHWKRGIMDGMGAVDQLIERCRLHGLELTKVSYTDTNGVGSSVVQRANMNVALAEGEGSETKAQHKCGSLGSINSGGNDALFIHHL
ncbi:hypothetical protein PAXRUDRAFT_831924 [Paxillus rubicundulus Ve08.2h10]|uniref:Uncharacterized protein n=1 Tax=Paxillus rubicundulus Ve08.2h10 TaxID=930991 RepID=A0A0D0DRL8_9AGAM|nr:hypothetical protein PAXRUDRAFT_831924 [Paxillus rubicundulus Ve08.2h10]